MSSPIHLSFKLTRADIVQAIRGFQISQGNNRFFGFLLVLMVFAGILGLVRNGIEPSILAFVVLASGGLIYSYFVAPSLAASRLANDKSLIAENNWTATHDELIVNIASDAANVGWGFYQDFIELNNSFLLVHSANKQSFQIVPKRAFKTASQLDQFRGLLRDKYETSRKSFVARNWRLLLAILFVLAANLYVAYILAKSP